MNDDIAGDDHFHRGEVIAQQRWGTASLWDSSRRRRLLWRAIPEELHPRIEGALFFFLSTSSRDGRCDCSFKGGGPNLVRVLGPQRIAFPDFDGNGAFMSLGNIIENPFVGFLFIDFADGARLRVNGRAAVHEADRFKDLFPHAPRVVAVDVEEVIPNCANYVPRLAATAT
jgi:predicted pyridoxine 5'-phosphate oxidase superfamily flavin-nucleotide-binding protein